MKASMRISGQDSLRLVYGLAQGSLLAVLWIIIEAWMPAPSNPGLGLSGLLLPATALVLILARKRFWSPALLTALSLAVGALGIALLLRSFFHTAYAPPDGLYLSGHYARLVLALACAGLAWFKGWRLPAAVISPKRAVAGMQWGLVSMAALLFVSAQGSDPPVLNAWAALCFVLFSLTSLWLAQKQDPAHQSQAAPMGAGGTAFLCGLGAVGLTSLLLWGLAGTAFRSDMAGPFNMVSRALGWGLTKIEGSLLWFFGLFKPGRKLKFNVADVMDKVEEFPNRAAQPIADSGVFASLLLSLIVGVAAVIFLVWLFRRLSLWFLGRKDQDAIADGSGQRGSLQVSFWALLKKFMRRLWSRLAAAAGLAGRLFAQRQPQNAEHYFKRLLTWAKQRGFARRASQTPYEMRDQLARAAPDLTAQLHIITQAFVQWRYGPEGHGSQAEPQVVESWQRIKASKSLRRQRAGLGSALTRFAKIMTR